MAIRNYIGWNPKVNKIILDSSTISVGKDATKSDNQQGKKRSILAEAFTPDEFSIEMDFNWVTPITDDGKTEYQLFLDWYRYEHKYGTVPFEFPQILYSGYTGILIYDEDKPIKTEYYKIVNGLDCSKNGFDVRVKMTWKNVYSGVVIIPESTPKINGITDVTEDYIDISFESIGNTEPTSSDFTVISSRDNVLTIAGLCFSSNLARIYFQRKLSEGIHQITFTYTCGDYFVKEHEFTTIIEVKK